MSNVFTLDDIRKAATEKFGAVEIPLEDGTVVTLQNILRLDKDKRKTVRKKLKELEAIDDAPESEDFDSVEQLEEVSTEIIEIVADRPAELLAEVGDDFSQLLVIIEFWLSGTQPGEAESSLTS